MHFVGAGKGRLVTDYGEYELSDGMMFITGQGVVHSQFSEVEDSMDEFSVFNRFEGMYPVAYRKKTVGKKNLKHTSDTEKLN